MYSLIIKNAFVVDGTGAPGRIADVAIEGDRIATIQEKISSGAHLTVDGTGKVLAPGFIDIQNHSDGYWLLFDNSGLDSMVAQGYTTILVGQCGASLAPLLGPHGLLALQKWHSLSGVNVNWQSYEELGQELASRRFGCNVASLVGLTTLRRGLVGDAVRPLKPAELRTLAAVIEQSLQAGAFGVSSGLGYAHEQETDIAELVELLKVVAKYDALFSVHLRSEGRRIFESIDEVLDISRQTGVETKISHFKIRGKTNHFKLGELLDALETAWHRGSRIHFDTYPYSTSWQVLYNYLPRWATGGGMSQVRRHLQNPTERRKLLDSLKESDVNFPELIIASTANQLNVTGKKISQIAADMGLTAEESILQIIEKGGNEILVFDHNLDDDQVDQLMHHPLSFIATDGGGFSKEESLLVHPRCFGTAPQFLQRVQKGKMMGLPEAIRKLTGGPADKMRLKDRGTIQPGNFADLVLLDMDRIADKSTLLNPYQHPEGIELVIVNGEMATQGKTLTGKQSGKFLRKTA